jgi:hypothetical protein
LSLVLLLEKDRVLTFFARLKRICRGVSHFTQAFAAHSDPLVEAGNWVAILIGTHLPLWPLYVLWAAGRQSWPTSLATMSYTPIFLVVPLVSRRSGLLGRIFLILASVGNTEFTRWVLGTNTGTELFFVPCAMLAAILFRRQHRWLMVTLSIFPVAVWYLSRDFVPTGLHHYDPVGAQNLFILNALSVGVLATSFGWLQANTYARMERR